MATVFVYGPFGRIPLAIETLEDAQNEVKKRLEVENVVFFTDREKTCQVTNETKLVTGMKLYAKTEDIQKKEAKANLCTHPLGEKCINCVQTEIFNTKDESRKEKYLTYGNYKQMMENQGKALDDFDYKKKICKNHPVNVTCMKCMDTAITLKPQIYRHVDYVEFESPFYVENLINEWRGKGKQQFGLLLGTYKQVDEKERAVVSTIFVPKQKDFPDGIHLDEIETPPFKGLEIIGAIYTDLFLKEGKQSSYKIENDVFLTAYELEFFGRIMKELRSKAHDTKNPITVNKEKFIFVSATPDAEMQISLNVFLPTQQFYAVSEANLIELSTDPSTFIHVSKRELLYMFRNEYNIDVSTKADPYVPVEYFFVTCETGYSKEKNENIIFNNFELKQTLEGLEKIGGYFDGEYHEFYKYQNFYLLQSLIPHYHGTQELFTCVINKNYDKFYEILNSQPFIKLITLLEKHRQVNWNCAICTYLNAPFVTQCEMCGTPKGG